MERESNNRSEGRANVFLSATIATARSSDAVRIRNLSFRGALIEAPVLPSIGVRVRLLRGSLSAEGVLAWQGNGQGGINFDRPIDVRLWVRRVGHAGQERVDSLVEAIRSYDVTPNRLRDGPTTERLSTISAALDQVCERLAGMASMSVELADELLRLDAISQSLRDVAR